jgi:protein-tyrosine kinase
MSRIHQALAKAARERASQTRGAMAADIVEIAAEVRRIPNSGQEELTLDIPETAEAQVAASDRARAQSSFVRSDWEFDARFNAFAPGAKDKAGAERFRTLRSRLFQIADTKLLRRVMVTSSVPSEGKSFVCLNLAQAMVQQQNRRVLLIDADLRIPTLHKTLPVPRSPGLSNYLRGECDELGTIQLGRQDNLYFMPAGDEVANPSELLLGDRMKELMRFGAESFDWVILDSPPALPVHDPNLLADLCDGVLFVVRAGATDFELVSKATSEFRKKNLLGIVFNHVEKAESYRDYYYG